MSMVETTIEYCYDDVLLGFSSEDYLLKRPSVVQLTLWNQDLQRENVLNGNCFDVKLE